MDLSGEYTIKAKRQEVWDALNDPEVLKKCIPGCDELEKTSDTELNAKVSIKVGVVRAKMKGEVTLSEMDAPNSYRISGAGKGGVAGFAKGGAKVSLADGPNGCTVLTYEAQAELGGKLAAVGSRVIQGVSKKMADDFFGKFTAVVSGEEIVPVVKARNVKASAASAKNEGGGFPDWLKSGLLNAVISIIAVTVAVGLTNN